MASIIRMMIILMMETVSTSEIIKSSRATGRVKLLNGEKTNISRTISVLVLRVLKWLEFPSVSYIPA
jgi:hypothetical protein